MPGEVSHDAQKTKRSTKKKLKKRGGILVRKGRKTRCHGGGGGNVRLKAITQFCQEAKGKGAAESTN